MVCKSPRVKPGHEKKVLSPLAGAFAKMSSSRFHCAICGTGLSVGAESLGRLTECPACHHVVPVPAVLEGRPGAVAALPLLPRNVLSLEIKFLCPDCGAKLRIDARLEGQSVDCPKCTHQIRIPAWSAAPSHPRAGGLSRTAELSEAEIEFLSGPQERTEAHAATG